MRQFFLNWAIATVVIESVIGQLTNWEPFYFSDGQNPDDVINMVPPNLLSLRKGFYLLFDYFIVTDRENLTFLSYGFKELYKTPHYGNSC